MKEDQENKSQDNSITHLTTIELRQKWAKVWGIKPHRYIRREMLEKSLAFKLREQAGNGLTPEQQRRLDNLIAQYRRDPEFFNQKQAAIKPGTRLVRVWKGSKYSVLALQDGFEYGDRQFTSLSEIAFTITGTRWNGWVFFGLKKRRKIT